MALDKTFFRLWKVAYVRNVLYIGQEPFILVLIRNMVDLRGNFCHMRVKCHVKVVPHLREIILLFKRL